MLLVSKRKRCLQEYNYVILFNILFIINLTLPKHVSSRKTFRYLVVMEHGFWLMTSLVNTCFNFDKAWHLSGSVELFSCLATVKFRVDFKSVSIKQPNGGTRIGARGSNPRTLSEISITLHKNLESFMLFFTLSF